MEGGLVGYPEPVLLPLIVMRVTSTKIVLTSLLSKENLSATGANLWTHFQMETWLLLVIRSNALDANLKLLGA